MQDEIVEVNSKILVGITVRTNNQQEMTPMTGKIPGLITRYMQEKIAEKIPNRSHPGTLICAYTHYTQGYQGEYTYFVGEEVSNLGVVPEGLEALIVPAGSYRKFLAGPGPLPMILIQTWQKIWAIFQAGSNPNRNYRVDFEVYDNRAQNPLMAQVDIYIGVGG